MKECVECNICSKPTSFFVADEVSRVNACVRFFKDNLFTVWRCKNCGSLHCKEVADLDAYYAKYPFKDQKLDFFARIAYSNRIRLLKRIGVTEDSSIIDYGCGKGLYVDYLKAHGFKNVAGYDPYIARFNDNSVLQKKYDVVVSHDVIEHVEDPRTFLQTMMDLSKPKGLVVIGTPNASEIDLFDRSGPPIELSQPYHRHIFSEQALFGLAKECGFEPVQIYRRFYFDSLYPGANVRFMWSYLKRCGSVLDAAVEPFRWGMVLTSPALILQAFFGYFWRSPGNILISFRNAGVVSVNPLSEKAANG